MDCILPQNGTRFAAKWIAFCRKMERVLDQNGTRFGPKWNAFWPKMGGVLAQNGKRLCTKRVAFVRVYFYETLLIPYYQAGARRGET